MLITIIIVILLILAYFNGARRGLVLTLLDLVGLIVIFFLAAKFSAVLGEWLYLLVKLFEKNQASWQAVQGNSLTGSNTFYYGIAYWLIIIVGGLVIRRIIRSLNMITKIPIIKQLNSIAGGVFSLVLVYLLIFAGLLFLQAWPSEAIRNNIEDSQLAQVILHKTPVISQQILEELDQNTTSEETNI
ncbi:CvpA family protein [Liquorilactobacillus oeni]|uniref:Membrane ancor connecting MutS2 with cell-division Z-ring n=1 Tax=Liquorilactobacillus oeni DSM 19972 TaxID=1423777 RepID=A0A0R1MAT9_9LACO|nr:CvpA family protein [Liquorilactobacillus oeni]KRL05001.1 membrane ancor connecting MutS2 with cell-division Z-ring [Liquorilactobacillus oeni DSM 19972]